MYTYLLLWSAVVHVGIVHLVSPGAPTDRNDGGRSGPRSTVGSARIPTGQEVGQVQRLTLLFATFLP